MNSLKTWDGRLNFHPLAWLVNICCFITLPMGNYIPSIMGFFISLFFVTWFAFVPLLWIFTGWKYWDPQPLTDIWDEVTFPK